MSSRASAKAACRTSLNLCLSRGPVCQRGQDDSRGEPPRTVLLASRGDGWQGEAGRMAVAGWQLWSPLPADPPAGSPGSSSHQDDTGSSSTRGFLCGPRSERPHLQQTQRRWRPHGRARDRSAWTPGPAAHEKADCATTYTDTENALNKGLCRQRACIWRCSSLRSCWVRGVGRLAGGHMCVALGTLSESRLRAGWVCPCAWGRLPPSLPSDRLPGLLRSLLAEF